MPYYLFNEKYKKNINKQTLLEQTKNILYNQLLTANASVQH